MHTILAALVLAAVAPASGRSERASAAALQHLDATYPAHDIKITGISERSPGDVANHPLTGGEPVRVSYEATPKPTGSFDGWKRLWKSRSGTTKVAVPESGEARVLTGTRPGPEAAVGATITSGGAVIATHGAIAAVHGAAVVVATPVAALGIILIGQGALLTFNAASTEITQRPLVQETVGWANERIHEAREGVGSMPTLQEAYDHYLGLVKPGQEEVRMSIARFASLLEKRGL